jgi:hypothetical protein
LTPRLVELHKRYQLSTQSTVATLEQPQKRLMRKRSMTLPDCLEELKEESTKVEQGEFLTDSTAER